MEAIANTPSVNPPISDTKVVINNVLSLNIGNSCYGIDAFRIQEIIKFSEFTMVYHAPIYILGVINLRGRIITVIDLALKLGISSEQKKSGEIIIVEWKGEGVGLVVDRAAEVIPLEGKNIRGLPPNIDKSINRFLSEVYSYNGHLITILNIDELLRENKEGDDN
ncbi:MAG: chemotaxis protein CheW [Oligoflexia bacterium]|nr:chemotaxis protein CheW [Oligoflexia bacterium]